MPNLNEKIEFNILDSAACNYEVVSGRVLRKRVVANHTKFEGAGCRGTRDRNVSNAFVRLVNDGYLQTTNKRFNNLRWHPGRGNRYKITQTGIAKLDKLNVLYFT